tara:strand:- start:69 stop:878 length:810 start_codon:yes stop_codon:yes gene_type:complete
MAIGSDLINTSANGQPNDNEDRPFSFAIGTQLFLNPNDDPRDGVVSFKVDPTQINGALTQGESNLAIGFANDQELNTLASWSNSQISTASTGRFPVGFGRLVNQSNKIGVNIEGSTVMTIGRPTVVESVNVSSNELVMTNHPFSLGDRVLVSSTGLNPTGPVAGIPYYVIDESVNSIKLSTTLQNAESLAEIDIQTVGSGTITVASDQIFTLKRAGSSGTVTLETEGVTFATFTNVNLSSPLRLFYWNREQSASLTVPVIKEIKVTGAI